MQLVPDWIKVYGPSQFEDIFHRKFHGPGFYLSDTDTLLVLPVGSDNEPTPETIWKQEQVNGTLYRVYVYNRAFAKLAFSVLAIAPVRGDHRTLGPKGRGLDVVMHLR